MTSSFEKSPRNWVVISQLWNHRATFSALPNTAALFATTMALTNEEDDFDGGMVKATSSNATMASAG